MASTSYSSSNNNNHQHTHPHIGHTQDRVHHRPQCTPAHSFKGFYPVAQDGFDRDSSMDIEDDDPSDSRFAAPPPPPPPPRRESYSFAPAAPMMPSSPDNNYGAFASDAFAPLQAQQDPFSSSNSNGHDDWQAFKTASSSRSSVWGGGGSGGATRSATTLTGQQSPFGGGGTNHHHQTFVADASDSYDATTPRAGDKKQYFGGATAATEQNVERRFSPRLRARQEQRSH